ncbi:hypothetical protein [Gordonia paraffinivorans]|uniref:hypothetical protein n=1 Tax=Gordonia paraffinivorans TaxID=175628 RepID=UPI003FCE1808
MTAAAQLMQVVEEGFDNGSGIDWVKTHHRPDTHANRRRIIDREHTNGETPRADGWLYMRRVHGDFVHVQRIKWIDRKWLAS